MWLRFRDLQARGVVKTRPTLKKLIERHGFPVGRMTGGQRTWTEQEIGEWRESCPVEGPALKGAAKKKHGSRQRKADDGDSASA